MPFQFRQIICMLIFAGALHAQPRIELQPLISGLTQPLFLTHAADRTDRRFILEQPGRIRVLQSGAPASTVFLDITSSVLSGGERGLLGLAFHPQFSTNGRFFVDYTRRPDGATVIAEYRVSASNPNAADSRETVLLTIPQPFANHNGGMISFGPDGFLYIAMGDGGSANDPGNRAQNIEELLGKILRIDVDLEQSAAVRYSSPSNNPFFGNVPGRDEIFAYGLRNPWRFSFDRSTGQLFVADVGQNAREEIDIVTLGGNYGWRVFEGTRCTNLGPASCTEAGFIAPIAEYVNTGEAGRCSITGGYVYRGSQQSLPFGAYVYGDFCSGEIFMLKDGVQSVLLDTALSISSFGEDEGGEIYVTDLRGSVQRVTNPDARGSASSLSFAIDNRGGTSIATTGGSPSLTVGYGRIQADAGSTLPAGLAIFGLTQNGRLVSEATVPASPLIQGGRIYAEVGPSVNTGIAIANPNSRAVTLSFFFTESNGNNLRGGVTSIPANQQIAAFLNQSPFNGGNTINGTFTFTSSLLVSAVALRGLTNERSEFLMTTLPVAEVGAVSTDALTVPHFVEGGGWRTRVVLVNPTDDAISGTIQFLGQSGQPISSSAYAIAPRAAADVATAGTGSSIQAGSVRVSPDANSRSPAGIAIFTLRKDGVTVTEAGVPALGSGTAFRAYVETSNSIQPGIAIANPSSTPASVSLELTRLDGTSTGLTGSFSIAARGQTALFLNQISGFQSIPVPFQGVLRIASASVPLAVTSLRGRTNDRGDFLISDMPAVDESSVVTSSELLFPHLADGEGYAMQFALFNGRDGQSSSGTLYFFNREGQPLTLFLR